MTVQSGCPFCDWRSEEAEDTPVEWERLVGLWQEHSKGCRAVPLFG